MSSNRKQFFINGILLSLVALAIRGIGMAFNSYLTRSVGAEGIGLYTLVTSVYSFGITFATSGLNLTVTRLVAADIGERGGRGVGRIMRNCLIYALIFSISATAVLLIFSDYFAIRVLADARAAPPLRALALSLVPIALTSLFSGYFVGVRRVAHNAAVSFFSQLARVGVTVFAIIRAIPHGAAATVLALAVCATATELFAFLFSLIQYLFDRRRNKKRYTGAASPFSAVTNMALPLAVSAYIRSGLLTLEHILIPKRLRDSGESHTDALASYGILHGMALPLLIYPMTPLSSFSGLLVPEFASGLAAREHGRLSCIASEAINTTLVYSTLCAVLVATFSEELGWVMYSSWGAGHYISLMAPVIPIMYLDHVADSMLKGIGEHVYSMWVNIADSCLSVILVYVLIPIMGIGGYAVVIVAMEGFNFALSATRLYKKIPFRVHPVRCFLLPLGASLAASALTRALFFTSGAAACTFSLALKLVFSVCVFLAIYVPLSKIKARRSV